MSYLVGLILVASVAACGFAPGAATASRDAAFTTDPDAYGGVGADAPLAVDASMLPLDAPPDAACVQPNTCALTGSDSCCAGTSCYYDPSNLIAPSNDCEATGSGTSACANQNDCAPGMLCDGGRCRVACSSGSNCNSGENCEQVFDEFHYACFKACDPGNPASCPPGETCKPFGCY